MPFENKFESISSLRTNIRPAVQVNIRSCTDHDHLRQMKPRGTHIQKEIKYRKEKDHTMMSCGSVPMNGDPVVAHTNMRGRNEGVVILLKSIIASKVCSTSLKRDSLGIPDPARKSCNIVERSGRPGGP